jgi:murein DD-endopeptidase MepM/ murein hydrolase activator NlpD
MHFKHVTSFFKKVFFVCVLIGIILVSSIFGAHHTTLAATKEELQTQIDSHSQTIKQLQDEISTYKKQLQVTATQARTLQSTIKALDINAKKLSTDLSLTSNKISVTTATINQLNQQITDLQKKISVHKKALIQSMQSLNERDQVSLLQIMLTYPDMSTFWREVDTTKQFQTKVTEQVSTLRTLENDITQSKSLSEGQRKSLVNLQTTLSDQKTVVEANKNTKTDLLVKTKDSEKNFKNLIADREAKEKAFEDELNRMQAELNITIDPKSVPAAHSGILSWPTEDHIITQYFGNTSFSQAHAAVYSGHGHNGIDIGIPMGTPIMAAAGGTVLGTGNTDTVCPGASFGKWVLVQHNNGLSTLYAHLSVIKASAGDHVDTGSVVGYSGMTGYATGPHLHFTVYASQGVKIISRMSASCGRVYTLPVADLKAYLNPLSYL